jgi:hypothetical protein
VGERRSGCIHLRRFVEDLVVPCRLFAVARDTATVEVGSHCGSVDTEASSELADARAGQVGINDVVDIGGGEAPQWRV